MQLGVWIRHCKNKTRNCLLMLLFRNRSQESGECLMIWACDEKFADICCVPLGKAGGSMIFPDSGHSISGQRLPCGDVR